ncbi:hypothetical protein HQ590_10060 [bacterium]|nr:hypothetical protein [bacterium]
MSQDTEKRGLLNARVKVVLRRFHPQTPRETMRGTITEVDEYGVRLSGRRFREFQPTEAVVPEERPVEVATKTYWLPYTSIRYSEIIPPGSPSERLDNEIQRRKPFTAKELTSLQGV